MVPDWVIPAWIAEIVVLGAIGLLSVWWEKRVFAYRDQCFDNIRHIYITGSYLEAFHAMEDFKSVSVTQMLFHPWTPLSHWYEGKEWAP